MKRYILLTAFFLEVLYLHAANDPRCLSLMGMAFEGPVDSVRQQLTANGFSEWGQSDDGEDIYFRGNFYGIRAKLLVSKNSETNLVTSAYVTIGPYGTEAMLTKNIQYFLYKLQKDHGEYTQRDDSYFFMDNFGSVKLAIAHNFNGSREIRITYLPDAPYYKDALCMGLRGDVQEVVTENAVAEEQFLHFHGNGQLENTDLVERHYDRYGYLLSARMQEQDGYSTVDYTYDEDYRLIRRTLTNESAGITYINEYTYNDQDEAQTQRQKVFDSNQECLMTINMRNNYLTRDDNGNWTSNSLDFTYWEKGGQTQRTTVLQKRILSYWE